MLRRLPSAAQRWSIAAGAVAMLIALSACAPEATPDPTPTQAQPTSSSAPDGPAFIADGSAEDNLPLFEAVTAQVWAGEGRASGRAYVDALVGVGFDRETMQVTQDATTVGNPVESLQFSVAWGDAQCLVGQVGPSTGEPVTMVLPQLEQGRCLVGTTRPIDW